MAKLRVATYFFCFILVFGPLHRVMEIAEQDVWTTHCIFQKVTRIFY